MSYKSSLLPDYVDIVQATSLNFYNNSTNILKAIGDYLGELDQFIQLEQTKVSENMLVSIGNLFNILNATDFYIPTLDVNGNVTGVKKMDNIFILNFIEKYQSLSDSYKQIVNQQIQNNVYFQPFSDDVGFVADNVSVMDSNVNPYFDTYDTLYFYPVNMPATAINKLSQNELAIAKTFSYYNDPLIKRNLGGLQDEFTNTFTALTPHGTNLITDILYYNRLIVFQIPILTTLNAVLGNLSQFILFFGQLNPKDQDPDRNAFFFKYTITNIEGMTQRVDVLKNLLNKAQYSSLSVLGYPASGA